MATDGQKPRIHPKRAHKDRLKLALKRKNSSKEIFKSAGKQFRYIQRNLGIIDQILTNGKC